MRPSAALASTSLWIGRVTKNPTNATRNAEMSATSIAIVTITRRRAAAIRRSAGPRSSATSSTPSTLCRAGCAWQAALLQDGSL